MAFYHLNVLVFLVFHSFVTFLIKFYSIMRFFKIKCIYYTSDCYINCYVTPFYYNSNHVSDNINVHAWCSQWTGTMIPIVKRKFCPSLLIFSGLAGQVSYDLKLAVYEVWKFVKDKRPPDQSIRYVCCQMFVSLILTSKLFYFNVLLNFLCFFLFLYLWCLICFYELSSSVMFWKSNCGHTIVYRVS